MSRIILIVASFLLVLVPHFLLPLSFLSGARGAQLTATCEASFHPDFFLGLIATFFSLIACRYRPAAVATAVAGFLALLQAATLHSVGAIFKTTDSLVALGQTAAIRAHENTALVIGSLAAAIILCSLWILVAPTRFKNRLPTILMLATSSIRRKRYRTASLVVALSLVIGAFFSNILLTRSIENTLETGAGRLGADLMLVPKGSDVAGEAVLLSGSPSLFFMDRAVLNKLAAYPEIIRMSPQLYFRPFSYLVCCDTEAFLVVGYDPATDFTISPWIEYYLHGTQQPFDLVVGHMIKLYPGQQVTFMDKTLNIAASLETTGIGFFDNSAFIPIEGAQALIRHFNQLRKTDALHLEEGAKDLSYSHLYGLDKADEVKIPDIDPETISAVFIKTKQDIDVIALSERIQSEIPEVQAINIKKSTLSVKRQMTAMLDAFLLPIVVILAMGVVILGVVFSMSANERRREIGLMRAMGATRAHVFRIILLEAIIICAMGGIFGILAGATLILVFKNKIMAALEMIYIWPSGTIVLSVLLLTLALSIVAGIVAGLFPALRASRMEPYHAIRTGA